LGIRTTLRRLHDLTDKEAEYLLFAGAELGGLLGVRLDDRANDGGELTGIGDLLEPLLFDQVVDAALRIGGFPQCLEQRQATTVIVRPLPARSACRLLGRYRARVGVGSDLVGVADQSPGSSSPPLSFAGDGQYRFENRATLRSSVRRDAS
jgi:hypothetical protein